MKVFFFQSGAEKCILKEIQHYNNKKLIKLGFGATAMLVFIFEKCYEESKIIIIKIL